MDPCTRAPCDCAVSPVAVLPWRSLRPAVLPTQRQARSARNNLGNRLQDSRIGRKQLKVLVSAETATSGAPKFSDTEKRAVIGPDGSVNSFPDSPGVYGVFNPAGELQYIGLSRKVSATLEGYSKTLPELTHSVKVASSDRVSREQLVELWKSWMQQAVDETGQIPPGNVKGDDTWAQKKSQKSEIKLTPGKGIQDLNCSITDLIDQVVHGNKVVAFVKGTRQQPQCGFSYKVLSTLNELGADYEVLNVLDEIYNPGLRDAIKQYSEWPTIPQLFINGSLVGGADIIEELHQNGELKQMLAADK